MLSHEQSATAEGQQNASDENQIEHYWECYCVLNESLYENRLCVQGPYK